MIIGIDVGGTKIAAGVVGDHFRVKKEVVVRTDADLGRKIVIGKILQVIDQLRNSHTEKIGIGVAGLVDHDKGFVYSLPHFKGWKNVYLKEILEKETGLQVFIDNDAKCFTIAEYKINFSNKKNVVGITVGTGIGAGLIIDGKLYHGALGSAGEVGNLIMTDKKKFLLEDLCSGTGIEMLYLSRTHKKRTTKEINSLALENDKIAREVIIEAGSYFGRGLASIVNTLNPDVIVIGGGASNTLGYISAAKKEMKKVCIPLSFNHVRVIKSSLGVHANVIGASMICE